MGRQKNKNLKISFNLHNWIINPKIFIKQSISNYVLLYLIPVNFSYALITICGTFVFYFFLYLDLSMTYLYKFLTMWRFRFLYGCWVYWQVQANPLVQQKDVKKNETLFLKTKLFRSETVFLHFLCYDFPFNMLILLGVYFLVFFYIHNVVYIKYVIGSKDATLTMKGIFMFIIFNVLLTFVLCCLFGPTQKTFVESIFKCPIGLISFVIFLFEVVLVFGYSYYTFRAPFTYKWRKKNDFF